MPKFPISLFLLILISPACKQVADNKNQYFPIGSFLKNEMRLIDSIGSAVVAYHTEGSQNDTSEITKTNFKLQVLNILPDQLLKDEAMNEYEEKTIKDMQLDFIIINYTSKKNKLNTIDIHIDPTTGNLLRLYAQVNEFQGENQLIKKILWTTGKQLLVNTTLVKKNEITNKTDRFTWSLNN